MKAAKAPGTVVPHALLPQGPHGPEYVRDLPKASRELLRSEVTPWTAETARAEFLKAFEWIGRR